MTDYRKATLFLIIFFICHGLTFGQTSTLGKQFWVGFMENYKIESSIGGPEGIDFSVLIITASEPTSGVIEYPSGSQSFNLTAGEQYKLRISSDDIDLIHRTSGQVEKKGIYITSTGDIAVHAFNERYRSADGTVILPVTALGKEYLITSHHEIYSAPISTPSYSPNMNNESILLVVATEDETEIEITTSVPTITGNVAGTPSIITLNRGQSYQLKANGDLTGSRIRVVGDNANDCKKIAVFGGNKWTSVGNCGEASDHLFQQAYPVSSWGKNFVHVALAGRTSGEIVKVLAAENGTTVSVNGVVKGSIDRGKFLVLAFGAGESAKIETSKPASVTVFSKSMGCNDQSTVNANYGDPFMITYSPSEQFLQNLVFNAIDLPSIVNHYVNIIVKNGTQDQTILDGQNIGSAFSPLPGDRDFQIAQVDIAVGGHSLSNSGGFAAYVYGFGVIESYGYAAGAALNNLNFEVESNYDFQVTGDKVACLNQEGAWEIVPDNPEFKYFVWNFGDGTPPQEGKTVNHTFTGVGVFDVSVVAAYSPNSCDNQEEIDFKVEIIESKALLEGEISVCPVVESVMYRIVSKESVAKVSYEVIGGTVLQEYGQDSVLINWGPSNPSAKLIMTPFSESGCPGVPVELAVNVNLLLDAPIPTGPMEVCFDPIVTHRYETLNPVAGREFFWTIEGGVILSGQGSSQVEVSWDQPGTTGKISYTMFSAAANSCSGNSPELAVNVFPEIIVQAKEVIHVLCNGEATGKIVVQAEGGSGPFTYQWSHDQNIVGPEAVNLPAGMYTIAVTDQKNCVQVIEQVEITEPEPMMLVRDVLQEISCFGKADGQAMFEISGGVPPYHVDLNGIQTFAEQLSLTDLEAGEYSLLVQDQLGCSFPLTFQITSPLPMELQLEMTKPACPGGSGGEIMAITTELEEPLSYEWRWYEVEEGWVHKESSSPTLSDLKLGEYYLNVTDKGGCIYSGAVKVTEGVQIRMPTGFDPRQGAGLFEGVATCGVDFQLWIYNRWGQLIYFGNQGWDGNVSGDEAPLGTYTYIAQYDYTVHEVAEELIGGDVIVREVVPKDITEVKKGAFMLVR